MEPTGSRIRKAIEDPTEACRYATNRFGVWLSSRGYLGTNVFDREWDVLILLDTCKIDALRAVAQEYAFLDRRPIERFCSRGASSVEWIGATFQDRSPEELADTAYLACNGYADFVFEAQGSTEDFHASAPPNYFFEFGQWEFPHASDLGRLEHVWEHERRGKGDEYSHMEGHTGPRFVTDRGIAVGREHDFDRLVLHYSQPHSPYVSNALEEDRPLYDYERDPWESIKNGVNRELVWSAYLDDLRYALDDVGLLLENIDAETVAISADHGEAFGEAGIYGHPIGCLHPAVRFVPWVETEAIDTGSYEPEIKPEDAGNRDVDEHLRALGYV